MFPREQQKQIPVGIRNFRGPAGLPLPPLPGNGGDADEVGGLTSRQPGREAGHLDGGGVAHREQNRATAAAIFSAGVCQPLREQISRISLSAREGKYPRCKSFQALSSANVSGVSGKIVAPEMLALSLREWAQVILYMIDNSTKTGLRNAALCESLYPLDIDCQAAEEIFLRANAELTGRASEACEGPR